MAVFTSKVTTKGQATIPEALRVELSIKPGQRLIWKVEKGRLVALPSRGLMELSGCLTSDVPFPGVREEEEAVRALRAPSRAKGAERP